MLCRVKRTLESMTRPLAATPATLGERVSPETGEKPWAQSRANFAHLTSHCTPFTINPIWSFIKVGIAIASPLFPHVPDFSSSKELSVRDVCSASSAMGSPSSSNCKRSVYYVKISSFLAALRARKSTSGERDLLCRRPGSSYENIRNSPQTIPINRFCALFTGHLVFVSASSHRVPSPPSRKTPW